VLVRITEDSCELLKYTLDLVGVQDIRCDKGRTAEDCILSSTEKEMKNINCRYAICA
jgi:hypothetical protein